MSESAHRAVFLSYASQDAEAALRLCSALRAAGVEVWFDQNELCGGDAWDQKIRRQIKECALFVPIISANTQARLEGYFRIEWKLAAQRTHAMATAKAFLLPVVIDDTRDADAHVPEEFLSVQWTRLNAKATPESFAIRVTKLVAPTTASPVGPTPSIAAVAGSTAHRPARKWIVRAAAVTIGLMGLFVVVRPLLPPPQPIKPAARAAPTTPSAPAAPLTKAQQLIAQARALYEPWERATADDFALAERLLKEATDLEPTNGDGWAALAILSYAQAHFRFGRTSVQQAFQPFQHSAADRAGKLAPESDQTKLALALRYRIDRATAQEGLNILRELAARRGTDKFVLRQFGSALASENQLEPALACFERAAALPGDDANAHFLSGEILETQNRFEAAIAAHDRAIALRPDFGAAYLKKLILLTLILGDIERAKAAVQQIPARVLRDERVASAAMICWFFARDLNRTAETLRLFAGDIIDSQNVFFTKGQFAGQVHFLAGRNDAAAVEWRAGLRALERRLAANPTSQVELRDKILLLALLGERATAEENLRIHEQMNRVPLGRANRVTWAIYATLGRETEVIDYFTAALQNDVEKARGLSAGFIRFDPMLDAFRSHPRFQALVAEADRIFAARARGDAPPATASAAAEKSVAVLAFENKSDDRANEYFSDGIAEELLILLQRIPGLRVMGRASTFSFKGKSATVPEIGRALGVAHVVEGSVQKIGDRVKITTSLSRADTGEQEWSDVFTKELKDVFAVQSEIAQTIVGQLRGRLTSEAAASVQSEIKAQVHAAQRGGTRNPEAFQFYLQGKSSYVRSTPADVSRGIERFERAVAIDDRFATAWAAMARARVWQGSFEPLNVDRFRQARAAAEQALAVEPELAEAHAVLSQVMQRHYFDWRQARASATRALQLEPNNAAVLTDVGCVEMTFGDWDRCFAAAKRAVALDPINPEPRLYLAVGLFYSGQLTEAEAEIRRVNELAPAGHWARLIACQILLAAGRTEEAVVEARKEPGRMHRLAGVALAEYASGRREQSDAALQAFEAEFADGGPFQLAEIYAQRRDFDRAFKWLEHTWRIKEPGVCLIRSAFTLRNLHADPRWPEFLKKIGLHDEQLK